MNLNNLRSLIYKKYLLFLLLIFSAVTKLAIILPNTIPFSFDHGKDSLAILHMIKTFSPKLIGPWTSIPGLYFGPGWYYLLAPFYIIGNGNPVFAVLAMIILNLATIWIAYKYFGKLEAFILTTAPIWTIISRSAWNPFPMPFLMFVILTVLKNKEFKKESLFLIWFCVSLSFHFSSAYSVFYLIIIPIIIIYRIIKYKYKLSFKLIIYSVFGFLLPFVFQLLFELKHNFIETKSILNYISLNESDPLKTPFIQIIKSSLGEFKLAIFPEIINYPVLNKIVYLYCLFILVLGIIYSIKKKVKFDWEYLLFILIPIIGFFKLHFNLWYVYAMLPVVLIFFSKILNSLSKVFLYTFLSLLFLTPIFNLYHYHYSTKESILHSRQALPIKEVAIERIRQLSEGKSFSSYHYVPDIYDFSYQYLYFWKAFSKGWKLPYEFSYEPGKNDYIPEKAELMKKVNIFEESPKYIFYIVEKPENEEFLQQWWNRQKYEKIIHKEKLSDDVMLYQALPKNKI